MMAACHFYSDILDETRNGDVVRDDIYQVVQGGLDARVLREEPRHFTVNQPWSKSGGT